MFSYHNAWQTMNDLDMATTKITSMKEILDVAIEAMEKHDYNKAEALVYASIDFVKYYLDEHDTLFKKAWEATVVACKDIPDQEEKKEHSDHYYDYNRNDPERENPFKPFTTTITDDGLLVLPDEILIKMDLEVGDYIQWIPQEDGKIRLEKVDNVSIVENYTGEQK